MLPHATYVACISMALSRSSVYKEKHYRSWLQGVKSDKVQLEVQLIEESWDTLQSNYSCHQTA